MTTPMQNQEQTSGSGNQRDYQITGRGINEQVSNEARERETNVEEVDELEDLREDFATTTELTLFLSTCRETDTILELMLEDQLIITRTSTSKSSLFQARSDAFEGKGS